MTTALETGVRVGRRTLNWLCDERQRLRRNAIFALGLLFLLPSDGLGIYACPFHLVTGHICPACGLTRSISSLLHGEFLLSVLYHPLGMLVAAYLAFLIVHNSNAVPVLLSANHRRHTRWLIVSVTILVVGTWVLRLIFTPHILRGMHGV